MPIKQNVNKADNAFNEFRQLALMEKEAREAAMVKGIKLSVPAGGAGGDTEVNEKHNEYMCPKCVARLGQ